MKSNVTFLFILMLLCSLAPTQNVKASIGTGSFHPTQNTDNCLRRLFPDYWLNASDALSAGAYGISYYQYGVGMVFRNVTVPQGAEIVYATFSLKCRYTWAGTDVYTKIRGELTSNASSFSTKTDFDNRWQNHSTSAYVLWDNISIWTKDAVYTSLNISTIIQEVVDQATWQSGNNVAIFWDDFDDRSPHSDSNMRQGYGYVSEDIPPVLDVFWDIPGEAETVLLRPYGMFFLAGVAVLCVAVILASKRGRGKTL